MAWVTPLTWASSMVTATIMNAQIKGQLDVLTSHAHSGAAGMGSTTLSGVSISALAVPTFADQEGSPGAVGILQRNGTNMEYHNGTAVAGLYVDGASGAGTLRTLGTGATQAAAGNHTH